MHRAEEREDDMHACASNLCTFKWVMKRKKQINDGKEVTCVSEKAAIELNIFICASYKWYKKHHIKNWPLFYFFHFHSEAF